MVDSRKIDTTHAVLTSVALVEAWLDDRVTSSFDVLLRNDDDRDPLHDVGAIIGSLTALAGSFAERVARTEGADDITQCAHDLLDDYRQRALRGKQLH